MILQSVEISNFKSIDKMRIDDIENALILVGKNNTGKTVVLDAIRSIVGDYVIKPSDFMRPERNIAIFAEFKIEDEDLIRFHDAGLVSNYKRMDLWTKEFYTRIPSITDSVLTFEMIVNKEGKIRYNDGVHKNNEYIKQILPKIHYIDSERNFKQIQDDIILQQDDKFMSLLRNDKCIFDSARNCNRCFECIGVIEKKPVSELNVFEAARLFEARLYNLNLNNFLTNVNTLFNRNGGYGEEISYYMNFNPATICQIKGQVHNKLRDSELDIDCMSTGMRCIYILSLLEAYVMEEHQIPCIILIEDPEIFLHPKLQKTAGEIMYRLSKKNQVIFTTHSPNMLFNFTSKQIRQIMLDEQSCTVVRNNVDIDKILDDLGYTANDLMNVSFVFIVEGRQDKSRLPLLLERYYSEITDDEGRPVRVAIITTNSCTNIKTYANLKYINQLYLKDNFIMIRDGDGKDPEKLASQLCRYYEDRNDYDVDKLPKVRPDNVLILRYYSFENYFLNPEIMTKIGVIKSVDEFYETLFQKWNEYLYKLKCAINMKERTGLNIETIDDLKNNMDTFKIYMRGHNLFDIFYGRFRENETELLRKYVEYAPKAEFSDILNALDKFVYFENRLK